MIEPFPMFKSYVDHILRHNFLLSKKIREIQEYLDNSNVEELKNKRVMSLMDKVFNKNEFYSNFYGEHGISRKSIQDLSDIKKLPKINKSLVVKNIDKIKMGPRLIKTRGFTSGTTGAPLMVYRSYNAVLLENAYVWWYRANNGLTINDKKISIRGDLDRKVPYRYDGASKTLFISSYALNHENLKKIVPLMRDFNPKGILGYPSSLNLLASWLIENKTELHVPFIFTSSETLLQQQEEKIITGFNAQIFDWYGNAERTIALYRDNNHYFEPPLYSINEYNDDHIITTSLTNDYFPLIKYEVNDVIQTDKQYNEERQSVVINKIIGRIEDYIILPDDTKIGRMDVVFKGIKNIKMSQIVQESKNTIQVKIIPESNFGGKDEIDLRRNLVNKLGNDIIIVIEKIDEKDIIKNKSGKIKFVISKIDSK